MIKVAFSLTLTFLILILLGYSTTVLLTTVSDAFDSGFDAGRIISIIAIFFAIIYGISGFLSSLYVFMRTLGRYNSRNYS